MKLIKNYWNTFKAKKLHKKIEDTLFVVLIIVILVPTTRSLVLRALLSTGLFQPKIELASNELLSESDFNWSFTHIRTPSRLKEFKGKVIFLNFWATWCPPCVAELPSIAKLAETYQNDTGIVFILATQEKPEVVDEFLSSQKLHMPISYFTRTPPTTISLKSYPTTVIIDKAGNIITKKVGAADWNSKKVLNTINTLLKEKMPPNKESE